MFEEIIGQLDSMNVPYTEDYEMGQLTIDISAADKMQVIDVINIVNATGMEFTVDETSVIVIGGEVTAAPMEEEAPEDFNAMALDEMLG